jgi:alkylhydroperoxidase family enzyme
VRLYLLATWREASCFWPTQRAAVALLEALMAIEPERVDDAMWDDVQAHLGDDGTVRPGRWLISIINGWNRLNALARTEPAHGNDKPTWPGGPRDDDRALDRQRRTRPSARDERC